MTEVAAIVPNLNGGTLLERCLAALAAADGVAETIVVDDGSTDGSPERARELGARVLRSPGSGFAAAVNHGAAGSGAPFRLILNSDAFVRPDTVPLLVDAMRADERTAVVGAALEREDGSRARTFGRTLTLAEALRLAVSAPTRRPVEAAGIQPVGFVPLACALVRSQAWDEVGGLDERYRFYFEDHDLCWRLASAGWRVQVRWDARAVHLEGGSSRTHDPQGWFTQFHESRLLYLRKRYPRLWTLYVAAWIPSALAHAALWLGRAARADDRERAAAARRWASAYLRAAVAGLSVSGESGTY